MAIQTLDVRGILMPLLLLKVSQAYRAIAPGETLEVLLNGTRVPGDLFKILPDVLYTIIPRQGENDQPPCCVIQLKKKMKGV
jgi:TusA-related sulfurtransferase